MTNLEELYKSYDYPEKVIPHMVYWVQYYFKFSNYSKVNPDDEEALDKFIYYIEKKVEGWKSDQAIEAVKIYLFANRNSFFIHQTGDSKSSWRTLHKMGTEIMKIKHYSSNTINSYVGWWRQFYRFTDGVEPSKLCNSHFKDFLTYLAVERKVSSSTQNQALNGILFFYRQCLQVDPGDLTKRLIA